jgi:hypothetical protein
MVWSVTFSFTLYTLLSQQILWQPSHGSKATAAAFKETPLFNKKY